MLIKESILADIESSIKIQFDGMDAESHEIELFALGDSLKGIARIAAVAGHFAATQKYSRRLNLHEVRVVAREPKANCFSLDVLWSFVQQHQILSGSFGTIVAVLVPYVLANAANKREEMNILKSSIDKLIVELGANNNHSVDRLSKIVEKMALELRPSARLVVAPIGSSCKTLTIKSPYRTSIFDEADKEQIIKSEGDEITDTRHFSVLITELDLERGSCKVYLEEDMEDKRINAVITDPQLQVSNNPYSLAFAAGEIIAVQGKALLREGDLVKLFISDYGILQTR
jgi:hypothetical protein